MIGASCRRSTGTTQARPGACRKAAGSITIILQVDIPQCRHEASDEVGQEGRDPGHPATIAADRRSADR
jgi:hypothetical protein